MLYTIYTGNENSPNMADKDNTLMKRMKNKLNKIMHKLINKYWVYSTKQRVDCVLNSVQTFIAPQGDYNYDSTCSRVLKPSAQHAEDIKDSQTADTTGTGSKQNLKE